MHSGEHESRFDSRFLITLACLAGTVVALGSTVTRYAAIPGSDWPILSSAGRLMLAGDLSVYVDVPKAQVGPLALVFTGTLSYWVYIVAMCCLFPLFVVQVYRVSGARPAAWHAAVFALFGFAWHRWAAMGHLDDLLVIFAALGVVAASKQQRRIVAGAWFAVALAAKPTAIMLLPAEALLSPMVAAGALLIGGAVYLPFVAVDVHGFLAAGRGITMVRPHSLLEMLGVPVLSHFPTWVRPAQLVGVMAIGWLVGRRSVFAGLVAVFVFRPILEPGVFPSYVAAAMLLAFCFELERRRPPILTGLLAVAWIASSFASLNAGFAVLRYGLLLVVLLAVIRAVGSRSRPTSPPRWPTGSRPRPTSRGWCPLATRPRPTSGLSDPQTWHRPAPGLSATARQPARSEQAG